MVPSISATLLRTFSGSTLRLRDSGLSAICFLLTSGTPHTVALRCFLCCFPRLLAIEANITGTSDTHLASGTWHLADAIARQERPARTRSLGVHHRLGLASAYHHHFGEEQGGESIPTLHWRGAGAKTYHIAYAFIPDEWLPRLREVSIGSKQDWIDSGLSDHVPVVVDLADAEATPSRAE